MRTIHALLALGLAGYITGCGVMDVAKTKTFDVVFPFAGLNRRVAYGQQPPYSTPDCANVKPNSVFGRRQQGGSRGGLKKAWTSKTGWSGQVSGTSSPVQMLATVPYVAAIGASAAWSDDFPDRALDSAKWAQIAGGNTTVGVDWAEYGGAYISSWNKRGGAVATMPTNFNPMAGYTVSILIPQNLSLGSQRFAIHGGLAAGAAYNATNSWRVSIACGDQYSSAYDACIVDALVWGSGSTTESSAFVNPIRSGATILSVVVDPVAHTLTVSVNGVEKVVHTNANVGSLTNVGVGFTLTDITDAIQTHDTYVIGSSAGRPFDRPAFTISGYDPVHPLGGYYTQYSTLNGQPTFRNYAGDVTIEYHTDGYWYIVVSVGGFPGATWKALKPGQIDWMYAPVPGAGGFGPAMVALEPSLSTYVTVAGTYVRSTSLMNGKYYWVQQVGAGVTPYTIWYHTDGYWYLGTQWDTTSAAFKSTAAGTIDVFTRKQTLTFEDLYAAADDPSSHHDWRPRIDAFSLAYQSKASTIQSGSQVVAVSKGLLFSDAGVGPFGNRQFTQRTSPALAADRAIQAATFLQALYIADSKGKLWTGTASISAGDSKTITTSPATTWGDYGIGTDCLVIVTDGSERYVHLVNSATATDLVLKTECEVTGAKTIDVYKAPLVYSPSTLTATPWIATDGIVPPGCSIIASWRNRLMMAGSVDAPNGIFMCRSNNPFDWDYAPIGADQDAEKAIAFDSSTSAMIGDAVTAIVPASDDYVLVGCTSNLWMLRGDPGLGGSFDNLSTKIGIIGRFAWCRTPDGTILFLSTDGIYALAPGAQATPQPFSTKALPSDIRNVDMTANEVFMSYSIADQGVYIYITPNNGSIGSNWFIDADSQTFWPVVFGATTLQPTALLEIENSTGAPVLIAGCADGYLRYCSNRQTTDDATTLTSYVKIGPIKVGGGADAGIVTRLVATLAAESGDVTWELYCADSPEAAVRLATPQATGTWTAGVNYIDYPRVAGAAFVLKITSTNCWAMESINVETVTTGLQRKL